MANLREIVKTLNFNIFNRLWAEQYIFKFFFLIFHRSIEFDHLLISDVKDTFIKIHKSRKHWVNIINDSLSQIIYILKILRYHCVNRQNNKKKSMHIFNRCWWIKQSFVLKNWEEIFEKIHQFLKKSNKSYFFCQKLCSSTIYAKLIYFVQNFNQFRIFWKFPFVGELICFVQYLLVHFGTDLG